MMWQIKKLGDVCEKISNGSPVKQFDEVVGFPISRIETIWNQKIDADRVKYIKENEQEFLEKYALRNNDILFSHINSDIHLGKTAIYKGIPKVLIHGINILLLRTNELVDPNYFNYHLIHLRATGKFISIAQKSVNQSSINQFKLKNVDIVVPPLPIQLAIVSKIEELLSDLENGKQQLLTAQQQLKVYRQSLLKAAFEGHLNHDSDDLYDEHEKGNHENQNNHNHQGSDNLPKGWKWVKIEDICSSVEYGSAIKSQKAGKIPVLRMGNIQNGIFDWDDLVFTSDDNEIKKYLLNKNDVLFNRTNSAEWVGKTAIYKGERPAIFAGYLIRINRIVSLIDANYLTYYLNTKAAKSYGNSVRSFGVNQSNINGTKLKTYPIPLPPLEQQQQIVAILESKLTVCDKIEETITNSLLQAESLWQSILKKAFEGKLI